MAESSEQNGEDSKESVSELDKPMWSVVSFERTEASGMTYRDAVAKLADLEANKTSGLCIVTDDAASRVSA
jgi:hypothetical protein